MGVIGERTRTCLRSSYFVRLGPKHGFFNSLSRNSLNLLVGRMRHSCQFEHWSSKFRIAIRLGIGKDSGSPSRMASRLVREDSSGC